MSANYIDGNERTYTVGGVDVSAYKLVETTSGVVVCTASSTGYVGVTTKDALATYTVPVRQWNSNGTALVTASGTVAADAPLTFAAGGCVKTWFAGAYLVGFARAAAASGAEVECQLCAPFIPATDAGLSRDVGTVTFASVVAGDEVTFTPTGGSPITFTAIAASGTPTELQFKVGAATNAAGDITAGANLAIAMNASATAIAAGVTAATPTTAAVTCYCDTRMEITPSSGDGAKVVCVNHTNESQFGELKDRLGWLMSQNEDRDAEITALETTVNTASTGLVDLVGTDADVSSATGSLYARDAYVQGQLAALSLLGATGNIAANSPVTVTAETTARFAYASTSLATLYGFSSAGGTAGAACTAVPWLSRAKHTCRKTAAAVAIGDLVYIEASGQIATVTAGAGKVVCGIATTASAGAADVLIDVAPITPYITAA